MSAGPLPPPLKIPEVSRFINRANQLRTIKPAIAYWCEYHAVNQIVTKNLHTSDDDCFAFTKSLIERLEATKTERADDDAVVDNTAGQAYVEQFAQETFSRAERAMRANKVTRQTADTFDAAATFYDLTREWGTPEPEVLKRIKFAKWNAARILRAIREGRDPNESNPQIEQEPEQQPLDPSDAAVRQITDPSSLLLPPASVEDVEDAGEQLVSHAHTSYHLPPASAAANEPFGPSPSSQSPGPSTFEMPSAPTQSSSVPSPEFQIPMQPSPQIPTKLPSQFAPPPPEPSAPASNHQTWTSTVGPPSSSTTGPVSKTLPATEPVVAAPSPVRRAAHPHPAASAPVAHTPNPKSIEQAQKHAKWAISALNFEDVPTAVLELRNALAVLGSQ